MREIDLYMSNHNVCNELCQCQSTDYRADDSYPVLLIPFVPTLVFIFYEGPNLDWVGWIERVFLTRNTPVNKVNTRKQATKYEHKLAIFCIILRIYRVDDSSIENFINLCFQV